MYCDECQNKIEDFIHDRLELKEASEFSEHMMHCDNCYNELEINYCMQTAITELKGDLPLSSGDFTGALKNTLSDAVEKYRIFKRNLKIKRILVIALFAVLGVFLGT